VEVDGWTILPIASDGATSHLIATRDDHMALATDIDVVLYERTADGWLGSAYDPSMTLEDAAVDLAAEFGLTSPLEGSWLIDLDPANITGHILPRVDFESGFFTANPLYMIAAQLDDPDPLAEAAEQSGFPAATSAVNTGRTPVGPGTLYPGQPQPIGNCCTLCQGYLRDAVAAGADAFLSGQAGTVSEAEAVAFDTWQNLAACCLPWTWTTSSSTVSCTGTSPWLIVGQSDQNVTGGRTRRCVYERNAIKVETRDRIRRCFNCQRTPFTQTRTITGVQTDTANTFAPTGQPLPACPSGPTPSNPPGCSVEGTATNWAPPPPSC
jgi:hypothetical protein